MQNDERFMVLEQYKIYSQSKEAFTNRSFGVNRFYLVFSLVLFMIIYIVGTITPSLAPLVIGAAMGMAVCVMWWLNLDSYQRIIKVKYSKVLEEIEKLLPVSPCRMEFLALQEAKKSTKGIIFSDFQKTFTIVLFVINFVVFSNALVLMLANFKYTVAN